MEDKKSTAHYNIILFNLQLNQVSDSKYVQPTTSIHYLQAQNHKPRPFHFTMDQSVSVSSTVSCLPVAYSSSPRPAIEWIQTFRVTQLQIRKFIKEYQETALLSYLRKRETKTESLCLCVYKRDFSDKWKKNKENNFFYLIFLHFHHFILQ